MSKVVDLKSMLQSERDAHAARGDELAEIAVILTLFIHAWGKGDDRLIQLQVNAISAWLETRAARLAKES